MESSLYQSTSNIIRSPTPTRNHCLSPGVMLQSHVEPLMGKSRVTLPSAPVLTSQPITGFPVPCFPAARTSANWASEPAFDSDEIDVATMPPSHAPPDSPPHLTTLSAPSLWEIWQCQHQLQT